MMYQEVRKSRNGTADLLKGIAVLLMIQVHVLEQLAAPDLYTSALGKISLFLGGPFCAPVFMAVMGYYLASSGRSFGGFMKRGILLVAGGILLNTGRSAHVLFLIFSGRSDLEPWHFIFGADILSLAGLSVIVTGILRRVFRNQYLPYLVLACTIAAVSPLLAKLPYPQGLAAWVTPFLRGDSGWSYFPLFPWLAYVLAGYALRLIPDQANWVRRINPERQPYVAIALWVPVIIFVPWASGITSDLSGPGGYYHHGILFFTWTALFLLAYLATIRHTELLYENRWPCRLVKWIGERVTLLYVVQWLIIGNLAPLLYRSQDLFQGIGWYVGITIVTCLTGYAVQKTRRLVSRAGFRSLHS